MFKMNQSAEIHLVHQELKQIRESMLTKSELNRVLETVSILSSGSTVRQIIGSENDVRGGKIMAITSVRDI